MSQVQSHYTTVEKGIESLGVPVADARGQVEGQWDFNRGSASVAVGVVSTERFPEGYFYTNCILMLVSEVQPAKLPEFYRTLLDISASLVNMKLCTNGDYVMLLSNRDATGLDPEEVAACINELSYYADLLDDRLKEGFIA